jgi:chemotaxis protein MotB
MNRTTRVARRRQQHDEPENHERWLVSYADFITLLFAFFVVMYAISTLNEGKYRVLADSLVVAFRNDTVVTAQTTGLAPINRTTSSAPQRPAVKVVDALRKQKTRDMQDLAKRISAAMMPLVQSGQVRLTQLPHGLAVEINASVLFAPAQANLQQAESIAALEAVAKLLAPTTQQIRVEGHTDHLPIANATYPSNWELSSARASSVVRLFIATGIAPARLAAVGYADHKPVEPNDTPEGRSRNRRVTLMILEDLEPANDPAVSPGDTEPVG